MLNQVNEKYCIHQNAYHYVFDFLDQNLSTKPILHFIQIEFIHIEIV